MATFGEIIRERRSHFKYGLREFCKSMGFDAGNWSRVERNLLAPPENEVIEKICSVLCIEGEQKARLFGAATEYRYPEEAKKVIADLTAENERLAAALENERWRGWDELPDYGMTIRLHNPEHKLLEVVMHVEEVDGLPKFYDRYFTSTREFAWIQKEYTHWRPAAQAPEGVK